MGFFRQAACITKNIMKCPHCGKSLWFLRSFCPFCKTNITAPPRPKSVTVVGRVFLILSCGALLMLAFSPPEEREFLARLRSNHPLQWVGRFIVPAVSLLSAGCVLLGHNWARWVLTANLGFNFLFSAAFLANLQNLVHSPLTIIMGKLLAFLVVGYYLFRPQARAFFSGQVA